MKTSKTTKKELQNSQSKSEYYLQMLYSKAEWLQNFYDRGSSATKIKASKPRKHAKKPSKDGSSQHLNFIFTLTSAHAKRTFKPVSK